MTDRQANPQRSFYDDLTSYYHLVYPDWEASIERQAEQLSRLIESHWPGAQKVLDVACGIGTQTLGLAQRGYQLTASDLSAREVERACAEAAKRQLSIAFSVADMREADRHHGSGFDVVVCADNSLPHLLTDADLLRALHAMRNSLREGGGCLITVRDYAREERGRNLLKPYGVREVDGRRVLMWQVWDFDGPDHYDLSLYVLEDDGVGHEARTQVFRSRYHAVSTDHLCALMREAGFREVQRLDGVFYQPVLIGTR